MTKNNENKPIVVCNKCGKPLDMWDTQENFSIHRHLGYGTSYDGDTLDLHLCCGCIEKLIEKCEVSPIVEG